MGRTLKYETPEGMQAFISTYFEDCRKNREFLKDDSKDLGKDDIPPVKPQTFTDDLHPTISGLGVALDLSRQGIINYEGKDEFVDTIGQAKAVIEAYNEQALHQNVNGIIFNLKNNFRWKDSKELSGPGGGPIQTKIISEIVDPKEPSE